MDRVRKDDCAEVTDDDLAGIRYLNLAWYGYDIDGESSETCEDVDRREPGLGWDGRMTRSRFGIGKPACPSIPVSRPDYSASADSDTTRITALREGDLDGLTNLWYLTFEGQGLRTLPEGIFDDLGNLTDLSLSLNLFRTLREGVFDELESLTDLDLSGNLLVSLPEDIFTELGALEDLDLFWNNLRSLPEGVFDGLESLLPAGVFDGLDDLQYLWLLDNQLTELPEDIFDEFGNLEILVLTDNRLTTIRKGLLGDLDDLHGVSFGGNELVELPPGLFAGLDGLGEVWLHGNPGAPFPFQLELTRTDNTDPMAPGPATVEVRVAEITDRATGRIVSIASDWDGVLNRDGSFPRVLGPRGDVAIRRSLPRPR